MHPPVQRVAFHLMNTMIFKTLLPPCSQKYAVKCLFELMTPDQLIGASANSQDSARLDVSANGVSGGRFQKTYLNVEVFNTLTPSNRYQTLAVVYRKRELEKWAYQL